MPRVHDGHKCKNIHGHTYNLIVFARGIAYQPEGWVMDFKEIKDAVKPVVAFDHLLLNDIAGLEKPTAELLAAWLWQKIKPALPALAKLELKETPTSGVIFEGE